MGKFAALIISDEPTKGFVASKHLEEETYYIYGGLFGACQEDPGFGEFVINYEKLGCLAIVWLNDPVPFDVRTDIVMCQGAHKAKVHV